MSEKSFFSKEIYNQSVCSEHSEVVNALSLPDYKIPNAVINVLRGLEGDMSDVAEDVRSDLAREFATLLVFKYEDFDREKFLSAIQDARVTYPDFDSLLEEVADIAFYIHYKPGLSEGVSYDDLLFPERVQNTELVKEPENQHSHLNFGIDELHAVDVCKNQTTPPNIGGVRRVGQVEQNRSLYESEINTLKMLLEHLTEDDLPDEYKDKIIKQLGLSSIKGGDDLYYFYAETLRAGFLDRSHEDSFEKNIVYLKELNGLREIAIKGGLIREHKPHDEYTSNVEAQKNDLFLYTLSNVLKRGEVSYLTAIAVSEQMRFWLNDTELRYLGIREPHFSLIEADYVNSPYAQYEFREMFGSAFDRLDDNDRRELVDFCKHLDKHDMEQIYNFARRYGKDGLRSLFAFSNDGGKLQVLWYGELLGHDDVDYLPKGIFKNYAKTVDQARRLAQEVKDSFPELSEDQIRNLELQIRAKASSYLRSQLESIFESDQHKSYEEIITSLEAFRTESIELTGLFKSLYKTGAVTEMEKFELLQDVSFETVPVTDLSAEDLDQIRLIYHKNWSSEPGSFAAIMNESLEVAIKNSSNIFFIFRYKGQIVGYNRFEDKTNSDNPHLYFGAFNVDPEFAGGGIGDAIYIESIKRRAASDIPIEADCDPFSHISKTYLRSGFVATDYYLAAGVKPSFHIVYDPNRFGDLVGSKLTQEKIIEYAESDSYKSGDVIIREIDPNDHFSEISEHRVLSQLFTDRNTRKTYGVFEYERQPVQKAA